ncbi:tetratricopeptide repeat protein [Flavobacteriaceae bacterium TK19130]|nr:tetratricopeptide repeat protein [Thermobacterium salinum]
MRAQNEADSLRRLLKEQQQDSSRVNTYLKFYDTDLLYSDNQAVIDYTHQALALSKKIKFDKGLVEAHTTLGGIYRINSESDSALFHYQLAFEKASRFGYYNGKIDALMGLGNTYNRTSDWKLALSYFNQVIDLATAAGDSVKIGSAHNNLGNTYLNQGQLEKALEQYQNSLKLGDENIQKVALINIAVVYTSLNKLDNARDYYQQGLEIAKRDNNLHHLAFIYKNLGVVEKKSKNYEKALYYYNEALTINEKVSDDYTISEIHYNIGNILFEQGVYEEAIAKYQESLALQQAIDHKSGACYSLLAIGMAYKGLKNYDLAIEALQSAERMADSTGLLTAKTDVTREVADILKEQGNFEEALQYQMVYKQLSDSLTAIRSEEKIAELETLYQTAKKEQEIELLSTENQVANLKLQKQQNLRNYLIILAIILILLIAVAYSRYQIKVKAHTKLKELDTLKTNFFTNISHEFRTPLTLILSPLEKILKREPNIETTQDLHLIKRNANRLLELINQILDLSKLEAGKLKLQVKKGTIEEFLSIVVASFASLAQSNNITFTYNFENLPKEAFYDEDKLYKIINNLLSNAFKITPAGGSVRLKAFGKSEDLLIQVEDTGPGLSTAEQEQIFERFHQNERVAKVGGTGIGLTLTKELITLHHGSVSVASKQGEGTIFTASIPITPQSYTKSELSEVSTVSPKAIVDTRTLSHSDEVLSENNLPIALVVENNSDLRNHIGDLLRNSYSIHLTKNGQEGIDTALSIIPDIIISDVMMPEVDGMELCRRLKVDERTSHIPIILLTAKADKPSKLDGLKIGADDYLTKPFDANELLIRVKNLIDQREKLQQRYANTLLLSPSKIQVSSPDEKFIKNALQTVEENLANPEFTVKDFQKAMGMSRMQLHRKLKALTQNSASEFIRDLRLQRAAELLSQNSTAVSDVAYDCGFNSLSYFAQCFKEKYGVPPSKYEVEVN